MLLLMQWPFKKNICAPIRLYDGSAMLKNSDRQTYRLYRQYGILDWTINLHYCA